jgi:glycosyltransferase involved in cell wall biosynthesis
VKACLITTGQPATNPRLVKEADALAGAGYDVHVVAAHWGEWATEMDRGILASRSWQMTLVDWRQAHDPSLFLRSRLRHWAFRKLTPAWTLGGVAPVAALSRVGPELLAAARRVPASIYIAHNLGALPVACAAAKATTARVGFDAEDFHSGQLSSFHDAQLAAFTRAVERRLIPQCAYVTAASPGIADAYRTLCGIRQPTCILNVFPLRERPARFRPRSVDSPLRLHWFSQTIGPTRGLEDAVGAVGLLRGRDIQLHLRGRWQPGYEDQLRRLAAMHGVAQEQIVSYQPSPPEDLVRLSAEYDIGLALEWPVSANHDILLSNKIFTYLLAGNAVIASRTSGQLALATELHQAASLCQPQNPASLAAAIKTWIENPSALDRARETAWHLGTNRYNWDLEQTKFLKVVADALRETPSQSSESTRLAKSLAAPV